MNKNAKFFSCRAERDFSYSSFSEQCWLAGLVHVANAQHKYSLVGDFCGVTERTARRWLNGEAEPHPACIKRLFDAYMGWIPQDGPWRGFRIQGKELIGPGEQSINPDIFNRLWLLVSQVEDSRVSESRARSELEKMRKYGQLETFERVKQARDMLDAIIKKAPA